VGFSKKSEPGRVPDGPARELEGAILRPSLSLALLLALTALSCGESTVPTTPPVVVVPVPAPTPEPTPEPTPVASPSPASCEFGDCEAPTTRRTTVVRVFYVVYQCFDPNQQPFPCPDPNGGTFKVGSRIKVDVTGKDAQGRDTHGVSGGEDIYFYYSDPNLVDEHIVSNWQRNLKILAPGHFDSQVSFDGVPSNELYFNFVP